jgi:hypothetical protein
VTGHHVVGVRIEENPTDVPRSPVAMVVDAPVAAEDTVMAPSVLSAVVFGNTTVEPSPDTMGLKV